MKRTTIKLPDDLDAQLRHTAHVRGLTISELTREAIEAHVTPLGKRSFLAAGAGHSGRLDIAERIEELLRQDLAG